MVEALRGTRGLKDPVGAARLMPSCAPRSVAARSASSRPSSRPPAGGRGGTAAASLLEARARAAEAAGWRFRPGAGNSAVVVAVLGDRMIFGQDEAEVLSTMSTGGNR